MNESLMKSLEQFKKVVREIDIFKRVYACIQELEQELQREKDRVALMGDATLHNTRKSAEKTRISKDDPRWCKEYVLVCSVVDREINLQEKLKVIYDKQDVEFGKRGEVCKTHGHQWREGRPGEDGTFLYADYRPNTVFRTCTVCGKCEAADTRLKWK